MKKFVKILCLALAFLMMFSLGACGNREDDGKIKLKISFFKAGFGDEWLVKTAEAFEDSHPDVKVVLEGHANMEQLVKNRLEAGNADKIADIVSITNMTFYHDYIRKGYLEDISDLYEMEVENGKKFIDVVLPQFTDYVKVNEKYYGIPWEGAVTGFAYNTKLFAQNGWTAPKTMKEFFELCDKIKSTGIAPIVYCGGNSEGYFQNIMLSWMFQYEGIESGEEFFALESADVFKKEGRKLAYEQVAKIVCNKNIVLSGSKGFDHLAAQREFIQGNAAMIPTGSWLQTEMSEFLEGFPNFEMAMFAAPAINDDGKDKNGNSLTVSCGNGDILAIPAKAANKELAKEFLLFMSTQEMLNLYVEKTGGNPRPYVYEKTDWSNLSTFGKSVMEIWNSAYNIFPYSNNALYLSGDVGFWLAETGRPVTYLQNSSSLTEGISRASLLVNKDYELALEKIGK